MIAVSNTHWVLHYWTATRYTFQPPFTKSYVYASIYGGMAPYGGYSIAYTKYDKESAADKESELVVIAIK